MMMPFAALYGGAVTVRGSLYERGWLRTGRIPIPVISVGNLTAGGSGKSPMAGWIAASLSKRGFAPAIVSRGYGGSHTGPATLVSSGSGPLVDARTAGDEPVMLARQLEGVPIVVSHQRMQGAAVAIASCGARCIVLDDGFQHRAIHRDLDLLLFDGADPIGNGRLLPAGPLREPLAAIGRAHAVIVTRADRADPSRRSSLAGIVARHAPGIPLFAARATPADLLAQDGRVHPLATLRGARVVAFAGIARPDVFFEDLRALGAVVVSALRFPDHHRYSGDDRTRIAAAAIDGSAEWILTTEKDMARLGAGREGAALPGLGAIRLRINVEEENALLAMIEGVLV